MFREALTTQRQYVRLIAHSALHGLSYDRTSGRFSTSPPGSRSRRLRSLHHHRAAFQARSVTATALAGETFDNRSLNLTALVELVLAVLITQMDVLRNLFGTAQLSLTQWALALVPAVALFFLWEIGKAGARRGTETAPQAVPAEEAAA